MKDDLKKCSDKELAALIRGKRKQSEAAFREIYDRYSARVNAYCMRIIRNSEAAEDIFQDTFFKFYNHVREDKESGTIIGFLITIARNLCLNYKRDMKPTVDINEYDFLVYETQSFEHKEMQDLVKRALDILEDEFKEPLIMRVYNGLDYKEIAEICETTETTARSRVFRAKKKIRNILKPYIKDLEKNN